MPVARSPELYTGDRLPLAWYDRAGDTDPDRQRTRSLAGNRPHGPGNRAVSGDTDIQSAVRDVSELDR
jgi:hypothetical protein